MTDQAELLRRFNELVRQASEDVLPNDVRLSLIERALRDHSRVSPRFVTVEITDTTVPAVSETAPLDEFILPVAFANDDSVAFIEAPIDRAGPISYLEPELRWRLVRIERLTATDPGYKVFFPQKISESFRIQFTLPYDSTNLGPITDFEVDAITLLAGHYAMISIASYYTQTIRGSPGEAADLVPALEAKREADTLADKYYEDYVRLLIGDDDIQRGPRMRTSEAAMRRIGNPIRHHMPRGQVPFGPRRI